MSAIETGGSAFPSTEWTRDGDFIRESRGMTLRDYFAAKAMQALIMQDKFRVGMGEPSKYEQTAAEANVFASAMLRAREAK